VTVEPIGYIVILLGLLASYYSSRMAVATLCLAMLFGAAAAFQLPSLGGNSIQPSHLMLFFVLISVCLRPRVLDAALKSIAYPSTGFWFAAYIIFSIISAFFLPRIFAGATLVYSSARDASSTMSTVASPLQPGSSNFTLSVYMFGDLICFAIVAGLARLGQARFVAQALIATAAACFGFAIIDIVGFFTNQSQLLDIIRNANYTMHTGETIGGFKRIVGSFPEASTYGAVALAFFSFTLLLWLERFPGRWAGATALCLGATVLFCTSTAAYVAGLLIVSLVILFSLKQLVSGRAGASHASFLIMTLLLVPCTIVGLMLVPDAWAALTDLANATFADKLDSQSGEERTAWNTLALISFIDTGTFGAGLGTVRTSSFLAALLSNLGILGTLLFALFLYKLLSAASASAYQDRQQNIIGVAALFASISQIISATIAGSSTDLGLLFSITAGLAAGCMTAALPETATSPFAANRQASEASPSFMKTPMLPGL
jgi:hypothetical protein